MPKINNLNGFIAVDGVIMMTRRRFNHLSTARLVWASCLILLVYTGASAASSTIQNFKSSTQESTEGFYTLSWDKQELTVELQEDKSPDFEQPVTTYRGNDHATVVSGKSDGDWYYRIRTITSDQTSNEWSDPLKVSVAHHSLQQAFGFFALGALIFISILLLITLGVRETKEKTL